MDGFSIGKRDDSKHPSSKFRDESPVPNSSIWLDLSLDQVFYYALTPLPLEIGSPAKHLLFEIPRRLYCRNRPVGCSLLIVCWRR